jgi:hypothetical protein
MAPSKHVNRVGFPSPLMGEGVGEGDLRVPPHFNPLPRRGEEVFRVRFSN